MHLTKLVLMGTEKDGKGSILGYRRMDNHKIIPKEKVNKIHPEICPIIIYNGKPNIIMEYGGLFNKPEANALILEQNFDEKRKMYTASYCKIRKNSFLGF